MNKYENLQENCIKWLKETPTKNNEKNTKVTTTMQTTSFTATTTSVDCNIPQQQQREIEEEQFRNATTTIVQQQPPNKFSLNTTEKVSGNPLLLPDAKGRVEHNKKHNITHNKDLNKEKITPKEKPKEVELNIMESSRTSSQLLEDFAKKKQERDQEIQEIQEMLNKIKSPKKVIEQETSKEKEELEIKEVNMEKVNETETLKDDRSTPAYRRSKSQLELKTENVKSIETTNTRPSRRDTARSSTSGATNKPRSKSAQLPSTAKDSQTNKKMNYNPEEARRYMEMQRKQRKFNAFQDPATKSKIEKEEIKKRLEELKKNTRKLVSKNLQKKEKILSKTNSKLELSNKNVIKAKAFEQNDLINIKANKELVNELKGQKSQTSLNSKNSHLERNNKETNMQETSHRSSQSIMNTKPVGFPLVENHKRIGLLRKAENDKDFSFGSHRNYNFDKENQNLELLTKQLTHNKENKLQKDKNQIQNKDETTNKEKKDESIQVAIKNTSKSEEHSDLEIPANNLKSKKGEGSLKECHLPKESNHKASVKTHDLPYWLKPSAAQVYPYNFIMAVRRKLEAIAEPLATKRNQQNQETSTTGLNSLVKHKKRKSLELLEGKKTKKIKRKEEEETSQENSIKQLKPLPESLKNKDSSDISKSLEDKSLEVNKTSIKQTEENHIEPLSQFKYLQKSLQSTNNGQPPDIPPFRPTALQKSVQSLSSDLEDSSKHKKASYIAPFTSSALQKSLQSLNSYKEDNSKHTKPFSNHKSLESLNSEINSNLSSISLQLPASNTLTEVSSLRTESRRTFNHSNKQPPNQTEDDISSLSSQIFSSPEKKLGKEVKDFEFVKPRPVSPLSLEKVDKLKIKRKPTVLETEKEDKEMDFSQLLEDFNRSLSQVIQVNEQLKCTLDKSHQILSPHSSKKSNETDKQYSSDFEKSTTKLHSSTESDKLKESLQKNNENLKQRKRQLFEMAEQVKPLVMAQKSVTLTKNQKPLPELNLDINLKSLSNSTETSEEDKQTETELEDEERSSCSMAAQSYEQRLNEIEKLKETLKKSILESKAKCKERQELKETKNEKDFIKTPRSQMESSKHNNAKTAEQISSNDISKSKDQISYSKSIASEIESKSLDNSKFKEHRIYEKYQKQYKSSIKEIYNENAKSSDNEKSTQSSGLKLKGTHNSETHRDSPEIINGKINSGSIFSNSNNLQAKKHLPDYATSNDNSSNYLKSESKKYLKHNSSSLQQKQSNESEADTYSGSQSEQESTKSKSAIKTKKSAASISSSIAEELQNTYESGSHDNENIPLNSNTKLRETNIYSSRHNESSTQFINSHINLSRGDFQESISKEAHLNETQFQQAIEAASQISSSEIAPSADDEVTSSVASKPHQKMSSNGVGTSSRLSSKHLSNSPSKSQQRISIGSEIVKFFTEYDKERAERHTTLNDSMSESSFNYSNVGLYDKLIQNETNKSQHLTALLKMREKALLDRTKGQIAWLEVQKARYKAKGLINHIAAIKKKQRGILLKMEKEREEIKRLLYTTTANNKAAVNTPQTSTSGHKVNSLHNTPTKPKKEKLPSTALPVIKPKAFGSQQIVKGENVLSAPPVLRATYELESSQALEELLKKREEDLRKRREHVERLMQWHQRLDEEEAEVLNLERQLLSYNNVPHMVEQQQPKLQTIKNSTSTEKLRPTQSSTSPVRQEIEIIVSTLKTPEKKRASRARKMEKRLKEIDKSLRELSHISASSTTSVVMGQTNNENEESVSSVATQEVDFVRTTGLKLNKLWKRLTSQQIEKFEPTRRYKLCKSDLERLYEEAKMAVLKDFAEDEERIAQELLEKSASNISSSASPTNQQPVPDKRSGESPVLEVPALNLNFSSGHSEPEEESANNSQANATQQGNYSPSVAEENFKAHTLLNSSASSETTSEKLISSSEKQTSRLESNVQMFLALSQRIQMPGIRGGGGLQRSLSDTEISEVPKFKADKSTTSQMNIANVTSQSNSSITTNTSTRSFDASGHQHQRSKSSIVEMTNIPSTQTQNETHTNHTDLRQTITSPHTFSQSEKDCNTPSKDLKDVKESSSNRLHSRTSVICSIGSVTPIKISQQTSSDIATITEDTNSSETLKTQPLIKDSSSSKISAVSKHKSSYSGQVGTDSETKAKEISSKLEEISAAVTKLSHMNALPSYESVTQSHSRNKSIDEAILTTNDESNLSTDASSYSFNFDNITTDKHSSPGTSSITSLHTNSLPNKTLNSKTFTKDSDQQTSSSPLYTSNSLNSTKSKTFVKDDAKSATQTLTQSVLENRISDTYEADFESDLSNVTHIEDITIPTFETTNETIQDEEDVVDDEVSSRSTSKENDVSKDQSIENLCTEASDKTYTANDLKNSPQSNNENSSLTSLSVKTQKPSPDRELLPPPPLPPPPPPPATSTSTATTVSSTATTSTQNGNNHLMPDIINELELRRHQLILDNEHLKQYEHVTAVPYMYVREIPNKPPPPYVPPAHGSPMTTIFPSEDRIKDITFRRTHELYCELLKTDYCNEKGEKLPSVNEEQITNIYERIILDICREYLEEHSEILRDGDPSNFHSQLAFFNPPNRLRCIQDAIYKEVRSCLAMDKVQPKRTQIYSVYGQRAKQDHIGKIIIQEMYDEDDRWCNFHREESEVLHLMVEEMINKNIVAIAKEVLVEEGGTIVENEEVERETTIAEENEANHQAEEILDDSKMEEQTQLLQSSSVLVETLNEEDDKTYCVNETKTEYAVLNQTTPTRIEDNPKENVNNTNNVNTLSSPNAVQTCT